MVEQVNEPREDVEFTRRCYGDVGAGDVREEPDDRGDDAGEGDQGGATDLGSASHADAEAETAEHDARSPSGGDGSPATANGRRALQDRTDDRGGEASTDDPRQPSHPP